MDRSEHLLDLINLHKPSTITEVGIAKGSNAVRMLSAAARHHTHLTYYGFDLFADGLTDDIRNREFQIGQRTMALDEARQTFVQLGKEFQKHGVVLNTRLYPGPTAQTLLDCDASALAADIVYIDGGHSVQTIRSDLEAFLKGGAKVICLDDFIHDRPVEFLEKFGANLPIQELLRDNVAFPPIIDAKVWPGDGKPFGAGQAIWPRAAWPWARLQAALHVIRTAKPKTVFIYADLLQEKYLQHVVAEYGGSITIEPTSHADLAYVDCVTHTPEGFRYMDADEAKSAWEGTNAAIRVFAGLRLDGSAGGAGHVMPNEDRTIVNGLDLLDGVEVGVFVWPKAAWVQPKSRLHIATRNCVADTVIQQNILGNLPKMPHWVAKCEAHQGRIILVSAGPSLFEPATIEHIKREAAKPDSYVLCVKHAHDYLIEKGVVPWGCCLLDPRDHVKQFIQNPHPQSLYFVATMCSHTTLDLLLAKGARVVGYNATVGAGEDKVLPKGALSVMGGTSSAMRALPLMMVLGFRRFCMFAMDSCYKGKPEKVGEKTALGYERFIKVEIGGRKFWSELELIAQAQDFKTFVETLQQNELLSSVEIEMHGDGIIQHIWSLVKPIQPQFEQWLDSLESR